MWQPISSAPYDLDLELAVIDEDGLATTEPGTVRANGRQIEVMWMVITDAGRRALG